MKKIFIIIYIITINIVFTANSAPKNLMVHSGPGNHYPIKAAIAAETLIRLGVCNPVWCYIHAGKLKGWVRTEVIAAKPEKFAYYDKNPRNQSLGSAGGSNLTAGTLTIRLKIISPFGRKDRRNNR